MTDKDIARLASRLSRSLVTKEDIKDLVTKKDIEDFVTKEDIKGLVTRDEIERLEAEIKKLASKEDIKRLEGKINQLDKKADSIMEFADEVDKTTSDHEKRLKRIEKGSLTAH